MPVRTATPTDLAEITALVREHAAHERAADRCHFDERSAGPALFGEPPTLKGLVAFLEEEPDVSAGCTLWYPTFSTWASTRGAWVEDLFVRPSYRRKGLGREMLTALRSMVDGRIEWDVHITNEAARQFYVSLGALPVNEWTKFRWSP